MKKKILFIAESVVSGVRTSFSNTVKSIPREKYEIHILIPEKRNKMYGDKSLSSLKKDLEDNGLIVKQIPMTKDGGLLCYIRSLSIVIKYIKQNDILLIDSHNYYAGLLGRIAAKICNIRSVHTPHLYNFHKAKGFTRYRYYIQENILGRFFSQDVICVSDSEVVEVEKLVKPEKIKVIHNGVFIPKIRNESNDYESKDKLVVGFIGRIEEEKRVIDILSAAEKLPHISFIIAGKGSLEDELTCKHGHLRNVKFLGFVDNPTENFYPKIDIYLQPSLFEGLSCSILEALAAGLPIITTNVPGNSELINNNGFLVKPKSPDDIVKAIRQYDQNNSILFSHSKQSIDLADKKFNINIRAKAVVSVWENCLC